MKVGEVFARLAMDWSQYNRDEATAKSRVQGLGTGLSGILRNAFSVSLGMGFFQAVQAGFRASAGAALGFNVQMQNARIGFATMLGSGQAADAMLNDLAEFAAKTPFEFPELLDAAKRMLALGFGADDVLPTLKAVGDAAAGLGLGAEGINRITLALGQMKAKGKVSGEEMRQLTEAGVPAWQILADAIGKTVPETQALAERGLLPVNKAMDMLITGMEQRFPNMMGAMQDSWTGVTSTIRDVWQMTLGAMTSGLFKSANEWLKRVRDTATEFYEAFRQGGLVYAVERTFGPGAASAVQALTSVLGGLWSALMGVARAIAANWRVLVPVLKALLAVNVATRLVGVAVAFAEGMTKSLAAANLALHGSLTATSGLLAWVSALVGRYRVQVHLASLAWMTGGPIAVAWIHRIQAALHALNVSMGPVGWAILAVSLLVSGGISLWNRYTASLRAASNAAANMKLKDYVKSATAAAQKTDLQTDALTNLGKASNKNLQSFDEVHQLMDETADASLVSAVGLEPITTPEVPPLALPEDVFSGLEEPAMSSGEKVKGFFAWLWDGIKAGAVAAWNGITGFLSGAWQWIVNLTRPIWEPLAPFFIGLWNGIKGVALAVWSVLGPALSALWSGIVSLATTVWGALGPFLAGLWNAIKTVAEVVWGLIQYGLGVIWFGIVEIAKAVWGALGPFFETLWNAIKTVAEAVWNGLSAVLVPLWNGMVAAAKTIWSVIGPFFEVLWAGVKWVFETVWQPLAAWLEGVWNGIKAVAESVWAWIQKVISDPITAARETVETVVGKIRDFVTTAWNATLDAVKSVKDTLYKYIVEPFVTARDFVVDLIEKAKDWGKNLIGNIVQGIKDKINSVKEAVSNVASKIKSWLGFSSPTEEGPGRTADQWAPNLMRMFSQGILGNLSLVQSAAGAVAASLQAMTVMPTPAFAGMAGATPSRQGGALIAGGGSAVPEIHLHVGTLVADRQGLKQLERMLSEIRVTENQRTGRSW